MMTIQIQPEIKSKIVLYTFPPIPKAYSMCPFGLKVESFLRINHIPYDICYTSTFGKNQTIPYLRLFHDDNDNDNDDDNDKQNKNHYLELCDSNEIIEYLLQSTEFETLCQDRLNQAQKAITHAYVRMLEEHTAQIGFYYRYGLHMSEFCKMTELKDRLFMGEERVFQMFQSLQPPKTLEKSTARGFTRYANDDVVWSMSKQDLQALEDLLLDEPHPCYFGGGGEAVSSSSSCHHLASVLDCAVFGHVSQFLYIPISFPQTDYIHQHCPKLMAFMKNFQQTVFPDWDIKCQKQPNEKRRRRRSSTTTIE